MAKTRARQTVGRILSAAGRQTPQPGTLTILMYHAVTAEPCDDAGQMGVSASRFSAQLAEIAACGARVVDLVDGVSALRRGAMTDAAVSIVFDDGFVGVHDHAAAALSERRYPATIFVTTAWVGRDSMPLAEPSLGRPMTWAELETLARNGFAIGSHTDTHPRLADLDRAAMRNELRRSRLAIADRIGRPPRAFAYPFGAFGTFDGRTRAALDEEGFEVACTTVSGRNRRDADPLALRRLRVSWCDGDGEIRRIVAGCYDWYRWVQRAQTVMGAGSKRTRPTPGMLTGLPGPKGPGLHTQC
ncbi:MAG: polysaccharide deacetylase family protein [Acidobacteria bacterium]|nr:polysaccharide deacetylase family protein [Acidobacteriota bacterium]